MTKHVAIMVSLLAAVASPVSADSFDTIKSRLAGAGCITVRFTSVLESNIFESVDSAEGEASIAADGRYVIHLAEDIYLATGSYLYSYSAGNNQVTVEPIDPDMATNTEITLLRSLDESYISAILSPDSAYRLIRRSESASGLPDSLTVYLTQDQSEIDRLEYFDINEELNRILIHRLSTSVSCDSVRFVPSFPDSVEVIELF